MTRIAAACAALIFIVQVAAAEPVFEAEAENLPVIGATEETKYAGDASGGDYVFLLHQQKNPADIDDGHVRFSFDAEPGDYVLRVRCLSTSRGSDSFWLVKNDESPVRISPEPKSEWVWTKKHFGVFSAGEITITLAAREPTRIDRVEVTRSEPNPFQHPVRQPVPDGRRPLYIDPPTFRWPSQGGAPYTLQLSRTEDFANAQVFEGIENLFLRPPNPIGDGIWYFRVRGTGAEEWMGPVRFEMPQSARQWPIEPFEQQLENVPDEHPRLFVRPEGLPHLQELAAGKMKWLMDQWQEDCADTLGAQLQDFEDTIDETPSRREQTRRRHAARRAAGATVGVVPQLCILYQVTGGEQWKDEALRRARVAASWDPHGFTSGEASDFANSDVVRGLAFAYDYLFDELSEQEREQFRQVIAERVRGPMEEYMERLETHHFNAHAWQWVLRDLTTGALAIYGEVPEAREWFEWSLKMHVALYPWYGEGDGSSAEGPKYHASTNMNSSLVAARLFEAATGVDITQKPWFRNNLYFAMYAHPPGGPLSLFGDGRRLVRPGYREKLAARLQAARYDNPDYAAYFDAVELWRDDSRYPTNLRSFLLLCWADDPMPEPSSLENLPDARLFKTGGYVYCHSNFTNPRENLHFEMRCSPYASYNHAHADNNSFNLLAYGEPIIVDSGYYSGYGDNHHFGWTSRTRAHNSILIDGTGQPNQSLGAYGWFTEFENNDEWCYFVGSCPHAYTQVQCEKFDRHVVWLKPDVYVIFDDLKTQKPRTFQWLLHTGDPRASGARNKIEVDEQTQVGHMLGSEAEVRVSWLYPQGLSFSQTDRFDPPPENWHPVKQDAKFPKQWHLTAETETPAATQVFASVIQPCHLGDYESLPTAEIAEDGNSLVVKVPVHGQERSVIFDRITGEVFVK